MHVGLIVGIGPAATDLGLASAGRDPGFRTFDCAVVHAAIAEVAAGRG